MTFALRFYNIYSASSEFVGGWCVVVCGGGVGWGGLGGGGGWVVGGGGGGGGWGVGG